MFQSEGKRSFPGSMSEKERGGNAGFSIMRQLKKLAAVWRTPWNLAKLS